MTNSKPQMQKPGQMYLPKGKRKRHKWAVTKPKHQELVQRVGQRPSSSNADLVKGLLLVVCYGCCLGKKRAKCRFKANLRRNRH